MTPGKDLKSRQSFIEWTHKGKRLRASVHLVGRKNNPWVIFAHGLTGQRLGPHYLFVRLSRALEKYGASSLRFDFAGSGESDGLFSDITIATMISDFLSAMRYVRRRHKPSHLILLGHSLGGCIAASCAGRKGADGLVLLAPVSNPLRIAEQRKDIVARGLNSKGFYENGPHEMGPCFLNALKDVDPIAELSRGFRGSLVLFQGDSDPSVSIRESGRYVHWARRAGIDTSYHVLKGADHNFSSVSAVRMLCTTVGTWIGERYL